MQLKFDIDRLVADLGGPKGAAEVVGVSRTTPYRWLASGSISSRVLARLKAERPEIDLDTYFVAQP